jgi:hypothetical protein
VQVRSDSDPSGGQMSGRVEHVVSGDSRPFTSLESLLAFMAQHATGTRNSE